MRPNPGLGTPAPTEATNHFGDGVRVASVGVSALCGWAMRGTRTPATAITRDSGSSEAAPRLCPVGASCGPACPGGVPMDALWLALLAIMHANAKQIAMNR